MKVRMRHFDINQDGEKSVCYGIAQSQEQLDRMLIEGWERVPPQREAPSDCPAYLELTARVDQLTEAVNNSLEVIQILMSRQAAREKTAKLFHSSTTGDFKNGLSYDEWVYEMVKKGLSRRDFDYGRAWVAFHDPATDSHGVLPEPTGKRAFIAAIKEQLSWPN